MPYVLKKIMQFLSHVFFSYSLQFMGPIEVETKKSLSVEELRKLGEILSIKRNTIFFYISLHLFNKKRTGL